MRGKRLVLAGLAAGLALGVSAAQGRPAGELDPTFGHDGVVTAPFASAANDVVALPNGKVVIAGYTGNRMVLARYTRRGKLDPRFGRRGKVAVKIGFAADALALTAQSDGKLVVAGITGRQLGTADEAFLARFEANGSLDPTFGTKGIAVNDFGSPDAVATSVALQPDGRIVIGGARTNPLQNDIEFIVARYRANGLPDPSFGVVGIAGGQFGNSSDSFAQSVAVDRKGRIVVGGLAITGPYSAGFALARFLPDGNSDPSFGVGGQVVEPVSGGGGLLLSLALQRNGRIVAAGDSRVGIGAGPNTHIALMRFLSNGNLDTSFGYDGKVTTSAGRRASATDLVLLPRHKLAVVGWADRYRSRHVREGAVVARYRANGSLDKQFGRRGIAWSLFHLRNAAGNAVALQRGGKLVLAGEGQKAQHGLALLARYLNR